MSAFTVVCEKCGARYIAGVVGTWAWPAHECPKEVEFASSPKEEADAG